MDWAKRAAEAILPLSTEKRDLALAFKEWRYTGYVIDLEAPEETCQLCGHPEIRYQFEIANGLTGASLLIGSECIKRFDISAVDEEGNLVDHQQSRAKVDRDRRKLVEDARERRMMQSLIALAQKETTFQIESFINYYKEKRGAFTPKQVLLLFDLMRKHHVAYAKSDFKLIIRRARERMQFNDLSGYEVDQLWGCMSATQRKWYGDRFPGRREEHRIRAAELDQLMARVAERKA
jgi:hypothetical protein